MEIIISQETKWEKEELLKILTLERGSLRCDLHRKLFIERENLVSGINKKIKGLEKDKNDLLKKHNLLNIDGSRYGCDHIPLHPELKIFDEQTNMLRKKILVGK